MVLLQKKDSLEIFVKRWEFLPCSGFQSRRNMAYAVESEEKITSFRPSFAVKESF